MAELRKAQNIQGPILSDRAHFPFNVSFYLGLRSWLMQYCPWVLRILAFPYILITRLRRMSYERGWFQQRRLPRPVISVGNMTVGGTGKTPFVIWLAQQLHAEGKRVAILSRGYGRQGASKNMLVGDGTALAANWRVVGDEPMFIAQKCPWAIVAVGKDRYRLGCWVLEQLECDCFLLDDGFQHLSLYRNLDFLLFDSTDLEGLKGVLPAGRLRESLGSAKGVEGLVLTRSECASSVQGIERHLEQELGRRIEPIVVKSVPKRLIHLSTGATNGLDFLCKKSLLLVCGIGNPRSFGEGLRSCGGDIREEICFPDHFAYREVDIHEIRQHIKRSGIDMVVTTEKDAVKIREWCRRDDPFWAIEMQMELTSGEMQARNLLKNNLF